MRKSLVASQVVFSFVLVSGALLFVKTLANLRETGSGFRDIATLVTFQIDPARSGYFLPRLKAFNQQVLESVRSLPEVRAAGYAWVAVARRTREIGLRLALGARPGALVRAVMKEALGLLAVGLVLGLPSAWALSRFVSSQLYGVPPADASAAALAAGILAAVAAGAAFAPARRASRIDPIQALRHE